MLPEPLRKKYEGIVIYSIVVAGLLCTLVASFFLAYFFKWERLMTQVKTKGVQYIFMVFWKTEAEKRMSMKKRSTNMKWHSSVTTSFQPVS